MKKLKELIEKFKAKEKKPIKQEIVTNRKQIGLEIKLPGCEEFVPLGRAQYNRRYLDDLGGRLMILVDESAELLEPSGVKTQEGKEEDALKAEIVGLMKSITQLGRSSGIHMIICPLRLSTVIPTIKGYTTMKDVKVGDVVFDSNGNPVNVIAVAPIKMSKTMYEMKLMSYDKSGVINVIIGSDGEHRFPVILDYSQNVKIMNVEEIYALQNDYLQILGNGIFWNIISIEQIENEPVRCIEVDSEDHLFLITDENNIDEEWESRGAGGDQVGKYPGYCVATHNTQRNDASIIPGVIQNNPLALSTKLRVRRKI